MNDKYLVQSSRTKHEAIDYEARPKDGQRHALVENAELRLQIRFQRLLSILANFGDRVRIQKVLSSWREGKSQRWAMEWKASIAALAWTNTENIHHSRERSNLQHINTLVRRINDDIDTHLHGLVRIL